MYPHGSSDLRCEHVTCMCGCMHPCSKDRFSMQMISICTHIQFDIVNSRSMDISRLSSYGYSLRLSTLECHHTQPILC